MSETSGFQVWCRFVNRKGMNDTGFLPAVHGSYVDAHDAALRLASMEQAAEQLLEVSVERPTISGGLDTSWPKTVVYTVNGQTVKGDL